jgi:hypothetical protein
MCNPLRGRLISLLCGGILAACGSNLTLPDDRSPAALRPFSGDGQEGTVGSQLESPLVVRVTDASAQPLAGVPVVFQFQSEAPDAEVDLTQPVTDGNGLAAAEVRLGSSTGTHIVEARVAAASDAELRATFDLTATETEDEKKRKGGRGGHHGHDGDDDDDDEEGDDDDD